VQVSGSLVSRRRAFLLLGAIAVAWFPLLIDGGAIERASALFSLADSPHPYFVPEHGILLYLWSPLVVGSVYVLLMSPGLFLSIACGGMEQISRWVVHSGALSIVLVSGLAGAVQLLSGHPLVGTEFIATILLCSLICFAVLLVRVHRGHALAWPFAEPSAGATIVLTIFVPLLILICLTPKFFWENLNGDGAHAFEAGRLLLHRTLPFWPKEAGAISAYPGITSMLSSFPISWFIRLFGNFEASARLPFILYLGLLYCAMLAMIQHKREARLTLVELLLVSLAVIVYAVVVSFNVTYSPYMADIALPAERETLLIVLFLGFLLSFLRKENGWMSLFLLLTFFTVPSASLMISLWLFSAFVFMRPVPWRQLIGAFSVLAGGLVLNAIAPFLLTTSDLPAPGHEFNLEGLLYRLDFGRPELRRTLFLVVPSGILPAFSILAWRKQDRATKALSLLTITYFSFFFIQSHVALHYFIPVMILPVIVFWKSEWIFRTRFRSLILASTAVTAFTALLLSLPPHAKPDSSGRLVGAAIEDRTGRYEKSEPGAFRRSQILDRLFPGPWSRKVPDQSYGGSPLVWYYYAHRETDTPRVINYAIQPATDPAPAGFRLLAKQDDTALYLGSNAVWESHKKMHPPVPACSPIYEISRRSLFPKETSSD